MIWVSCGGGCGPPDTDRTRWSLITHNSSEILVLLKLSRPADLSPSSRVRTIFLPSSAHIQINPNDSPIKTSYDDDNDLFDRNENYLRRLTSSVEALANMIAQVNQNEISRRRNRTQVKDEVVSTPRTGTKRHRRRNDKFLHRRPTAPEDRYWIDGDETALNAITYVDCVAVGWGKYRNSSDLSDALLKIDVPIQDIKRYVG